MGCNRVVNTCAELESVRYRMQSGAIASPTLMETASPEPSVHKLAAA